MNLYDVFKTLDKRYESLWTNKNETIRVMFDNENKEYFYILSDDVTLEDLNNATKSLFSPFNPLFAKPKYIFNKLDDIYDNINLTSAKTFSSLCYKFNILVDILNKTGKI